MGWMKGWVGLYDPDPLEMDEQPLTVLECDGFLLLACAKDTSPAVFVPKSCIPRPASPSFSTLDLDRSSLP